MSAGLQLILSTAMVALPAPCSWSHPGANPYRGDPVAALDHFDLSAETRAKLRAAMSARRYTEVVTITRDDIAGEHAYTDLRGMHSGHGKICHGPVDRSAWRADRRERALVYCADDQCVIVPVICNNVALVTRKPDHEAALDDGPIDIEPAAGIAAPPAATLLPGDFVPLFAAADALPEVTAVSGGGYPGGAYPVGGYPVGGGACCESEPINPGVPGTPAVPPTTAVPETPAGALLLAALVAIVWRSRRAA